ncbi:MAG: ABC transporter substrate-binding protein, partial [Armatimonadota bacterium]|nr:ABC transporter substrate-binding protein [Armatimonadota bacterium]
MKKWMKFFLLYAAAAVGFAVVLYLWGAMLRPRLLADPTDYPSEKIQETKKLRDVSFDPKHPPVVQRDVNYAQGKAAPWYPKGESPILADLVKAKKLPPVAERVGPEPLVLEGPDGIGQYGGTWIRVANAAGDVSVISWRLSGATIVRWSPLGYPIRPHIAKSWTVSPDRREWTFHLRKGLKWSDGHPLTADDALYWWEAEQLKFASNPPAYMSAGGQRGNLVKVDDYTIKFVFPKPNGVLLESLTRVSPFSPRHYLQKYHPDLGDEKVREAAMKARGLTSARALYTALQDFRNPEYPRLWPWIYRTYKASPPESFVRNPYFFAVDPQGNQLPYVDRILFEVKSPKLIPLSAASGDITMQARHITYDNYTLLMENRGRNGYEVYHWFPASRSAFTLWPNNNRRVKPGDPVSEQKAALLSNKTFRQALSLSINRWQIIKAIYAGYGEPAQIDPGRESEFHNEKLMKSFTEYDPDRANQMFDSLGLDKRDLEGMRTFPDGTRMTWYIDFTDFTGEGPAQFVVDDWAKVGIRAIHRERSRPLWSTEKAALLHDFSVWSGESEFNPLVEPRSFVATYGESHFAPATGIWYQKGGFYDNPKALQGGIAPPRASDLRRAHELLEQAYQSTTRAQQIKIFKQITDIAAQNVWSISIATPPPQLCVVKKGFRNVPRNVIYGASYNTPANAGIETFFFEKPKESPGALAQIKREMTTITPAPDAGPATQTAKGAAEEGGGDGGGGLGGLIKFLVYGILGLGIVLAAVRHPYIGRRILITIPTLLIISVVTFVIIQLPPG